MTSRIFTHRRVLASELLLIFPRFPLLPFFQEKGTPFFCSVIGGSSHRRSSSTSPFLLPPSRDGRLHSLVAWRSAARSARLPCKLAKSFLLSPFSPPVLLFDNLDLCNSGLASLTPAGLLFRGSNRSPFVHKDFSFPRAGHTSSFEDAESFGEQRLPLPFRLLH